MGTEVQLPATDTAYSRPTTPDRLWSLASLSQWLAWLSHRGWRGRSVKLTTNQNVVSRIQRQQCKELHRTRTVEVHVIWSVR